jgi:hypothetical protein
VRDAVQHLEWEREQGRPEEAEYAALEAKAAQAQAAGRGVSRADYDRRAELGARITNRHRPAVATAERHLQLCRREATAARKALEAFEAEHAAEAG